MRGSFSNEGNVYSYVAELSNPIYGGFSVVLQINLEAKTPFASLAGVYNCADSACSWTTFNVYTGSQAQFGTPYFDGEALLGTGLAFTVSSSPINQQVTLDKNFDYSVLQQANLFAVLSGGADSTTFVGPFTAFFNFGIAQTAKFAGDQSSDTARQTDIVYDSFSGTLQYDNGRAEISVSVSHHSNNKSPYPNVNIVPATLEIYSQLAGTDDFDTSSSLLVAVIPFSTKGSSISNYQWATSLEAVNAARNGYLSFYVINSDSSLYLRGQVTSYSEDNQNTIQH